VAHSGFFPPNEYFSALFKKKNWVTFKLIFILTCINRVKCYILVQEICGCDSNSAFTTLPSAGGWKGRWNLPWKWLGELEWAFHRVWECMSVKVVDENGGCKWRVKTTRWIAVFWSLELRGWIWQWSHVYTFSKIFLCVWGCHPPCNHPFMELRVSSCVDVINHTNSTIPFHLLGVSQDASVDVSLSPPPLARPKTHHSSQILQITIHREFARTLRAGPNVVWNNTYTVHLDSILSATIWDDLNCLKKRTHQNPLTKDP